MLKNKLYLGDNLRVLRDYITTESVDLIYLDPPFQSRKNYKEYKDTWRWDIESEKTYLEIRRTCDSKIVKTIDGFKSMLGTSDIMAYLVMMTIRLVELHRVLKKTGSLYLHCDPTASHYLKIVLDSVFDAKNFRNEIIWFYPDSPGRPNKDFPRKHDVIFRYTKTEEWIFNDKNVRVPILEASKERYKTPRILGGKSYTGGESSEIGKIPEDVWRIPVVKQNSEQALGYPTQKPEALLERIIKASSNENDIVLDPFCGCGTSLCVAKELNRRYIGIDNNKTAIRLSKERCSNIVSD